MRLTKKEQKRPLKTTQKNIAGAVSQNQAQVSTPFTAPLERPHCSSSSHLAWSP